MAESYSDQQWLAIVRGFEALGFSVSGYKRPQFERRLESFIQREGFPSVEVFLHRVRQEPALFQRFHTYSTIHVTEFFRDPDYWDRLRKALLVAPRSTWRIWSAGCSWGAEPVTLALMLESMGVRYEIMATDSDGVVLQRARQFTYSNLEMQKVPDAYRPFFRNTRSDQWVLGPLGGGTISFSQHDVLKGAVPGIFDLIVCRNLIIYFEGQMRRKVLSKMTDALQPGGLLFLGATETFLEHQELGYVVESPAIYRKSPGSRYTT